MTVEAISFQGRWEYFWALQKHWPEVIESLRQDVGPHYAPVIHEWYDGNPVYLTESWARLQKQTERLPLLTALRQWGIQFVITEDWIFEAALETLMIHGSHSNRSALNSDDRWLWRLGSRDYHPSFEPKLPENVWYPPRGGWPENWMTFKKRMEREVRTQLARYKYVVEKSFGVGREKRLQIEAAWAARWQKGESIAQIVQTIDIGSQRDPEQAVFRAIQRFAKSIRLNLRKKGQRPRRRVSVQPTA